MFFQEDHLISIAGRGTFTVAFQLTAKIGSADFKVRLEVVLDLTSSAFSDCMRIYSSCFPQRQRRPTSSVIAMLRSGKSLLVAGFVREEVAVMCLLFATADTHFMLCDYLAVSPPYQGQGIGSQFLQQVFCLPQLQKCRHILIEAEDLAGANRSAALRRISFYRDLGAREALAIGYDIPPLQGEFWPATPVRILVLSRPGTFGPADGSQIDGAQLRKGLKSIFCDLYGMDRDDEAVQAMLRRIPPDVILV